MRHAAALLALALALSVGVAQDIRPSKTLLADNFDRFTAATPDLGKLPDTDYRWVKRVPMVEGSSDGQKWLPLGAAKAEAAGTDVEDLVVSLSGKTPCRYLRATFAARQPEQKLTLVEAEIWGADQ